MKRRFGRRKTSIRWLPDVSGFSQATAINIAAVSGNFVSTTSSITLLPGSPTPTALGDLSGGPNNTAPRQDTDCLILDHLQGKMVCYFDPKNAGGEWMVFVRMGIAIVGTTTRSTGAGETYSDMTDAAGDTLWTLDPGASAAQTQYGSFVSDGVRFLWRRNFLLNYAYGPLGNEQCCPPGPYVDIKPRRILRPNEKLVGLCQVSTLAAGSISPTGAPALWWSPDIRIAAHNTKRRR